MNDARIREIERRLMRADESLREVQRKVAAATDAATMLFTAGGGPIDQPAPAPPATGGMVRFPNSYVVRVVWDVEPTLKTAASSNPTADTTSLATAVANMETGDTFDNSNLGSGPTSWWYSTGASKAFQHIDLSFSDPPYASDWKLAKYDGDDFLIDYDSIGDGTIGVGYLSASTDRFFLSYTWDRRNGIGSIIGTDLVTARRTSGSTATFSSGPVYGETGSWSFAMECPATTYHNAGSGTIYLEW